MKSINLENLELKDLTPEQNRKFANEEYDVLVSNPSYIARAKSTKKQEGLMKETRESVGAYLAKTAS